MTLTKAQYEADLRHVMGKTSTITPGLVVREQSDHGTDLIMVQSYAMWRELLKRWDGYLWAIWPRPINDAYEVWAGFFGYYEMIVGYGEKQHSVILCTTPELQSSGITAITIARSHR